MYDYLFCLSLNTKVNLKHLESRLKQTNTIENDLELTKDSLIKILKDRFDTIDYDRAKLDVKPFITNPNSLDLWSKDFFISITESIDS